MFGDGNVSTPEDSWTSGSDGYQCTSLESGSDMIPAGLLKRFSGPALLSACSAVANMVATVLIFRSCGAMAYANFIIDLAVMSIFLLVLELIPSSYSLYRIQDDPSWSHVVKKHLFFSACALPLVVLAIGRDSGVFQSYTPWIALFALTQVQKRYLDIVLQASGNVSQFMRVELSTSILRLVILSAGMLAGTGEAFLIWGALATSAALAQIFWMNLGSHGLVANSADSSPDGISAEPHRREYRETLFQILSYYPGIALRRVKDNILPLAGGVVLGSKELLGLLMLSYRGLLFANGQVRIFEAILSHRKTLHDVNRASLKSKIGIAIAVQLVAVLASVVLVFLADDDVKPYGLAVFVSLLVWPMVFYALERANAYSKYQAMRVNVGLAVYIGASVGGSLLMWHIESDNLFAFVGVFLVAEIAQLLAIKSTNRSLRV